MDIEIKRITINAKHLFIIPLIMRRKHLSKEEKLEIWRLMKEGKTHSQIGCILIRPQKTISCEIKRNSIEWVYQPFKAHKFYEQRRIEANISHTKLVKNITLRQKIIEKLSSKKEDRSPDTIAWRLKKERQEYICSSTIYKYIENYEPWLRKYLRYQKRYKKCWTKELRMIWNNIKPIESRDPLIEKRKRIGDWELDTVVSTWRSVRCFTAFDRTSRLVKMRKLNSWKACEVYNAMIDSFMWEKTLSFISDNGKEFAERELA